MTDLQRLQRFLDTLQTLEADFVQQVVTPEAGIPAESRGHISTTRPNRFRWDYHQPNEQVIVSNGEKIWFYERDLQQVTVRNSRELEGTPAVLLSAGGQLEELFSWEIMHDQSFNAASVRLVPKKRGTIQVLVLNAASRA